MAEHSLDRPAFSSLSSRHAAFAVGSDGALRFEDDVSPLAGTADDTPASLSALAAILPADRRVVVPQVNPIAASPGIRIVHATTAAQMVYRGTGSAPQAAGVEIARLGEADRPDMLALADLTNPGPYLARTPALGDFYGVRLDGRLVAMAGERLKQPGFTEVSGVCTHPDFRGRGLAGALCRAVVEGVLARGETPYLHAYSTNEGALRLYRTLGFEVRSTLHVAVLERA